MASVSGLVHVRPIRLEGLSGVLIGKVYNLRLRLLPWREEATTGFSTAATEDGEAVWSEEEEVLSLAHLSTTTPTKPSLAIEVRSRELYVYDRSVMRGQVDASSLVSGGDVKKLEWVALGGCRLLVELEFVRGATTHHTSQETRQHLFRLRTYTRPTWCSVCGQMLIGLRLQGFQCEACGLDCHRECQLRAHAVSECRQINDHVFLNEHGSVRRGGDGEDDKVIFGATDASVSPAAAAATTTTTNATNPSSFEEEDDDKTGIGRLRLHLKSVRLAHGNAADHYVRMHVAPCRDSPWQQTAAQGRRTQTVYESAEPRFDAYWHLPLSTFSSEIRLELVEASRDVVVGTLKFSALDLLQEEADDVANDVARQLDSALRTNGGVFGSLAADAALPLNKAPSSCFAPRRHFFDEAENCCFRDRGQPTAVARFGYAHLRVYDDDLLFSSAPRSADPENYPENFSIEIAKRHIERAKIIVYWFYDTYAAYEAIMRWTDPLVTAPLFVAYVSVCVWLDAERAGILPFILLCLFLLHTGRNRLLGAPKTRYFDKAACDLRGGDGKTKAHRPVAFLKLSVCAGRNFGSSKDAPPDVYVVVGFSHEREVEEARREEEPPAPRQQQQDDGQRRRRRGVSDASSTSTQRRPSVGSNHSDEREPEVFQEQRADVDDDEFFSKSLYDDGNGGGGGDKSPATEKGTGIAAKKATPSRAGDATENLSTTTTTQQQAMSSGATPARQYSAAFPRQVTIIGYTATCRRSREPRWHGALGVSLEHRRRVDASGVLSRWVGSFAHYSDNNQSGAAIVEPWERRGFGETTEPLIDRALVYPVLKPSTSGWAQSTSSVVFKVMRQHPLDRLLDVKIGTVTVPLSSLVDREGERRGGQQREKRGWYDLLEDRDEDEFLAADILSSDAIPAERTPGGPTTDDKNSSSPALYLRMRLQLGGKSQPTTEEIETSRAVEAMSQPLTAADDDDEDLRVVITETMVDEEDDSTERVVASVAAGFRQPRSTVGAVARNPLSTVASVHSNAVYAQNILGGILNAIESTKHALSWTHPWKTAYIFAGTVATMLLFWRCPTRWLMLAGGLYEFSYRLVPFFGTGSPMTTRFLNLLKSLPNDEDLRRCYEHRANSYAKHIVSDERRRRRRAKLHGIWKAQWQGHAGLKELGVYHSRVDTQNDTTSSSSNHHNDDSLGADHAAAPFFDHRYLVFHGRRLLWWVSEQKLDAGRAPQGQLLLQGHSGLTDPSPTDITAAGQHRVESLLAVFGQTADGAPLRWSLLLDSPEQKRALADAIQLVASSKLD